MKHLLHFFTIATALCLSLQLNAATYCAPSAWGHANGVTGGGNTTPTLVDTYDELKSALSSSSAQVIVITKSISFAGKSRITCSKSNKTILAKKGVVLETTGFESKTSGIFLFDGCSNIILRNIKMVGPGADDNQCQDLLNLDGATKVWVDHCEFSDGVDGNFDIVGNSDNITVSWCRFFYEKDPKADHQFSNLIGSNADMKPKDGLYTITFAYNWWDHGCAQRMTRSRHSDLHFLNCYWNSNNASYYIGPGTTKLYIEGCYFDGNVATKNIIKDSYEGSNSWTIVNSYAKKGLPSNNGTVSKPSYAYTAMAYADVPATITNSSCGAGATLIVTDQGVVSSSCDGNNENPGNNDNTGGDNTGNEDTPTTPTTPVEGDCCINLGLGEEPTVANKGIPADFAQVVVTAELAKGTWDNGYLNMGGNADIITFDFSAYNSTITAVTFDVTIPNWTSEQNTIAYHWNSNENSYATINSKNKQELTLMAPANAKSFTIQRSARTGTRISQICFDLKSAASNPTGLDNTEMGSNASKVIRNGQIFIIRDGKTYNIFGHCVE
ncbi:MAG: hypothetical protein UIB40_05220 [Paludibacteraceae bacterium]|nr:hypothetical protein [Paludibacteraceae bacterium]